MIEYHENVSIQRLVARYRAVFRLSCFENLLQARNEQWSAL
jgi:hypothetical protein